ncbi:MAG: ATP cone domain-containing protein, partial [Crocinitomicaceae bacterium]
MVNVEKASGDLVPFDIEKLRTSLYRTGANDAIIDGILGQIESELFEGMTTKEIYKRAFGLLKKRSRPSAAKYKLKRAIHELGPSGYPFEDFVAEILKFQGYKTKVGEIIRGHCVQHEVDIIAENEDELLIVECKFHIHQNRHTDVKVPLYIHSRYNDIIRKFSTNE